MRLSGWGESYKTSRQGLSLRRRIWKRTTRSRSMICSYMTINVVWRNMTLLTILSTSLLMMRTMSILGSPTVRDESLPGDWHSSNDGSHGEQTWPLVGCDLDFYAYTNNVCSFEFFSSIWMHLLIFLQVCSF